MEREGYKLRPKSQDILKAYLHHILIISKNLLIFIRSDVLTNKSSRSQQSQLGMVTSGFLKETIRSLA